jgi:acetylserotonin N-methyltransferase
LVYEACKHYPTLKGSILDLESALVFTRSSIARQAHSSPHISERISFISGNFFEDDLPDADIFVLSRIIHDWEEDKACKLLKRVYDRLPDKGAVLVCEMLLDEDGCGPTETLLQSLSIFTALFFLFLFLFVLGFGFCFGFLFCFCFVLFLFLVLVF